MEAQPDVFRVLGVTVRVVRARLDRALQSAGLRLGQFQVLRLLWEKDGMTPRELSLNLGVEMPTVTRTIQRMLRDGLVGRRAHPADARSVRIYLTSRGQHLREAVSRVLAAETERALAGFSSSERGQLVALLDRIAANNRESAEPDGHDEPSRLD